MSKKFSLESLFHRAPPVLDKPSENQVQDAEQLNRGLKPDELESRFREALASGKITGDILIIDENGNPVKSRKSTNIFDL